MAGRKPSHKKRNANNRLRAAGRKPRRRYSGTVGQVLPVHRRMVMYPKTTASSWLQNLSWFGGVVFKLFTMLSSVSDDLKASLKISAAGSTILFGPGDFAAISPVANKVFTSTDNEVKALRVLPYERGCLTGGTVRIVPSVDVGTRSGMYAAAIVPIDTLSELLATTVDWPDRLSPNYDDVLKLPNSVMSPADRPITLRFRSKATAHTLSVHWREANGTVDGYNNKFSTHALIIAFSSLAAEDNFSNSEYSPSRSLFEVHFSTAIRLFEPIPLPAASEKPNNDVQSVVTMKMNSTDTTSINLSVFGERFEVAADLFKDDGTLDLLTLDYKTAHRVVSLFAPEKLVKLIQLHPEALASMEC